MLFNSLSYLLFFPVVCAFYFALKTQTQRTALLLIASCYFYGFFIPKYLLVLFAVIAIDFYAAIKIEKSINPGVRKLFLIVSLAANLSILCFFKYFNFFLTNVNELAQFFHWNLSFSLLQIILPIGLSFHTFQSMAYVLEVYWKRFPAEKNLLRYAVYVLYFPQLVAGPIERPQNILPQLKAVHRFDYERVISGLYLIIQGLFKKAVCADTLAQLANIVFTDPSIFGFVGTALGVLAFSFQIYCDFSGYSDIARGSSRILGIELMINFNRPYFAKSISEFWRRWHISLSTWFRDYLFIPLGGSHAGKWKTCFNLFIVFAISGLWHGANWTFLIWGLLHGTFLMIENLILKPLGQNRWPPLLGRLYVFFLVAITWIFFRAPTVHDAMTTLRGFARPLWNGYSQISGFRVQETLIIVALILLFETFEERQSVWLSIRKLKPVYRWSIYWAMLLVFIFTAQFSGAQFIYFQF